jgi:hypothetical protein
LYPYSDQEATTLKYSTTTDLTTDEIVDLASRHFAERSLGLAVKSKGKNAICLDIADGTATLTACRFGRRTSLELEADRFDNSMKSFLKSL